MAVTFYTVIWSARISILFSIIRIDPDPVMRHRLKWLAAAFLAAVGGLFFQLFWTCEHIHGWKNKASPQCPLPKGVAIFQLISAFVSFFLGASTYLRGSLSAADILADLSLILLPLRLIRGIKDKRLRWRLIFIFSTSSEYCVVFPHSQNLIICSTSRDDDRFTRARSVHHQPRRYPRDHLRARRGLHVANSRQRPRRRDRLFPAAGILERRRRRRPALVDVEVQDTHSADDDR